MPYKTCVGTWSLVASISLGGGPVPEVPGLATPSPGPWGAVLTAASVSSSRAAPPHARCSSLARMLMVDKLLLQGGETAELTVVNRAFRGSSLTSFHIVC